MDITDNYLKHMNTLNKLVNPLAFSAMQKISSSMFPFEQTMSAMEQFWAKKIDFSYISSFQSQIPEIATIFKSTNELSTAFESNNAISRAFNNSGVFDAIAGISRNMSAIEAVNKLYNILPIVQTFDYNLSFSDDGNIVVDGETVSKDEIIEIATEFENSSLESMTLTQKIEKIKSKKGYFFVVILCWIFHLLFLDPILDKVTHEIRERTGINRILEKIDIKKWFDEIYNLKEVFNTIIQAISSKTKIENLFLFGSWANGNPKTDSDLDIYLVIPDSDVDICELNAEIRFSLYKKLSLPLDLVIAKKSVFDRRSKALTLESMILKEGVCIYGN